MSHKTFEGKHKLCEATMPGDITLIEMADRIGYIAEETRGVNIKDRLSKAADLIGLPFGRVRALWYGAARRVEAHEADLIRSKAEETRALKIARLRSEYEAERRRMVDAAPPGLARLVPPPLDEPAREAEEADPLSQASTPW